MSSGGHWSLSVWLLSIQCHGPPRCVSSVSSSAKDLDKLVNFSHEYGILTVDLLDIIAGGGPWARDTKSFLTHMVQHRVKTQVQIIIVTLEILLVAIAYEDIIQRSVELGDKLVQVVLLLVEPDALLLPSTLCLEGRLLFYLFMEEFVVSGPESDILLPASLVILEVSTESVTLERHIGSQSMVHL